MQHIVLVHGACHGAWCWYKVVPLLRQAGHRVTAVDLGGCGVHGKPSCEITTLDDYVDPLMDLMRSIDEDEKVIVVGHSFGGIAISIAMERYPEKIIVGVFISAYMPNCSSPPITFVQETFRRTSLNEFMDTTFKFEKGKENAATHAIFGPEILGSKLYQNCRPEDSELAKMLVKQDGLFMEDLAKDSLFTEQRYGRIKRVFLICEEDELVKPDFQEWIIEKSPPHQVKSIQKADHMVMLSRPQELCNYLLDISDKYQPSTPTKSNVSKFSTECLYDNPPYQGLPISKTSLYFLRLIKDVTDSDIL